MTLPPKLTGSGASATVTEMSFCSSTANGLLLPTCALPSSARKMTFVVGCRTVRLPVQLPLTKLPEFVGEIVTDAAEPIIAWISFFAT